MIQNQEFQNIPCRERSECAVCGRKLMEPLLSFPKLPLTEIFTKQKPKILTGYADQYFHLCNNCHHGQLLNIVPADILYSKNNYYLRTSESQSASRMNQNFIKFIKNIIKNKKFKTIIEFGCSDLYLLKALRDYADKLIGIDPILKGQERKLSQGKFLAIGDFLENVDLARICDMDKTLILSSHTMEHIENPKKIIEKLFKTASGNTIFIFQFPALEPLLADARFEQIFHQHLQYFTLDSFEYLIEDNNGRLLDKSWDIGYWGTLQVAFKKKTNEKNRVKFPNNIPLNNKKIKRDYELFREKMKRIGDRIKNLKYEKTYGFGAGLMLPVISYHLQNKLEDLVCILDDDPKKSDLFYINLPVAIKNPGKRNLLKEANVVITAPNATRSILSHILPVSPKRIIVPINTL